MTFIAVFDPGETSGLVLAEFTPTTFPTIFSREEIQGGMEALSMRAAQVGIDGIDITVCEKFRVTPRVYTAAALEAMRCEGAVYAWCKPVVWQYNDQLLIGGMNNGGTTRAQRAAANKRAADNVLRGLSLWSTGKQVGYKDANDVNSATKHLVAYLRNIGHEPTLEALSALL